MEYEPFEYKTNFKQSPFTPKPLLFKIVWTIIIILYCIAFFRTVNQEILINTIVIFVLCVIWLHLFFTKKDPKKAFFVILSLIVCVLIVSKKFYDIEPKYGKMQMVFIGWLFIATYFNYFIITNN